MLNTSEKNIAHLISQLEQPETSAILDASIKLTVARSLALENHFRAEALLISANGRLDQATKTQLETAMLNTRLKFGADFTQAYVDYIDSKNLTTTNPNQEGTQELSST